MADKEEFRFTGLPRIENKPLFDKIDEVTALNEKKYSIEYHTKSKKFAFEEKIEKAVFKNEWYCYYTDNKSRLAPGQKFKNSEVIVTIHGWPGNPKEMSGLQQSVCGSLNDKSKSESATTDDGLFCRWINFMVPGLDGETEIMRGDYYGYLDQLGDMIQMLVREHLQIGQPIISLGYSGGNVMWRFCQKKYPQLFKAHINICGPTILWIPAHFYMYGVFNRYDEDYNMRKNPKLLESIEFRRLLFQRFKSDHQGNYFEFENVPIMCNDPETLMIWFKAFMTVGDEGWTKYYDMGHNDLPILKFYACGEFDPLIDTDLMKYEYYYYTYLKQGFEITNESDKQRILADPLIASIPNFNFKNLQENFVFVLKKTGHTVHTKRPRELAKPLKTFISLVSLLPTDYYASNAKANPENLINQNLFKPKL